MNNVCIIEDVWFICTVTVILCIVTQKQWGGIQIELDTSLEQHVMLNYA